MKEKFIAVFWGLLVTLSAFAVNKDDVTMVSYEQSWLDNEGTLALRNNTSEEIRNVVFQITYLDMSGNPLDYEEFSRRISIAPGMTKKLDIPAYEHDRYYHYYKTKDGYGNPAFKIRFELKDYNVEESLIEDALDDPYDVIGSYNENDRFDNYIAIYLVILVAGILLMLGVAIGMYVLVAVLAKKRNRNVALWVLLSVIASPLPIIIILLVIGDDRKEIID